MLQSRRTVASQLSNAALYRWGSPYNLAIFRTAHILNLRVAQIHPFHGTTLAIALLNSLYNLLINHFPNSIGVIAEGCEIRCAEYASAFVCQLFDDFFVGHAFTNFPHELIL